MLEIAYQLPYPPSLNHMYMRTKRGVILNDKARSYREDVISTIGKGHTTLKQDLAMRVYLYMPDKRKRDIDNPAKAIFDSLTHAGVYADDSQIKRLLIEHKGVESPGRVVVIISEYE